jgi:hypothetical protein
MQTCGAHNAAFMGTTKLDLYYIDKYYGSGCKCWVVPLANRILDARVPPLECVGDHDNIMYNIYKNTDVYMVSNSTCYTCKQTFSQGLTFPLLILNTIRVCVLLVFVCIQMSAGEFSYYILSNTAHMYVVVIKSTNGTNRYTVVPTTQNPASVNLYTRFRKMWRFCLNYSILCVAFILDMALVAMLLYVCVFAWVEPVRGLCGDKQLQYGTTYFYRWILIILCCYLVVIVYFCWLIRRGVTDTPCTLLSICSKRDSFKLDMIML